MPDRFRPYRARMEPIAPNPPRRVPVRGRNMRRGLGDSSDHTEGGRRKFEVMGQRWRRAAECRVNRLAPGIPHRIGGWSEPVCEPFPGRVVHRSVIWSLCCRVLVAGAPPAVPMTYGQARVWRKNAKPSSASASWVSASGRQIAAARAIVWLSGVKDSMTSAPSKPVSRRAATIASQAM
jgi:hypothetical protein